jgi:hypothetical protein
MRSIDLADPLWATEFPREPAAVSETMRIFKPEMGTPGFSQSQFRRRGLK